LNFFASLNPIDWRMTAATNPSSPARGVRIRAAIPSDTEAVVRLINAAFIVERVIIDGDRTNPENVRALMHSGTFLLAEDAAGLAGCVYVEQRGERSYLGLLSVDPQRQGMGCGRQLAGAAEDYSREQGCRAVDLRIVSARAEILPFYRRLGYIENGTAPFPADVQTKVPAHFILMTKALA
jgi:GNAT superfamily N-acetyltransferase